VLKTMILSKKDSFFLSLKSNSLDLEVRMQREPKDISEVIQY